MKDNNDFILSVCNEVETDIKALVPTGKRNGWREITFAARFEPQDQEEVKKLTLAEAMEKAIRSVDFGNLKLAAKDADGNELTPLQIAMGNTFIYNSLLASYRDEVLTKNTEAKNSKTSRGR